MKIEIINVKSEKKRGNCFQADLKDCPGSPPVGYGKTKEEAVAALFFVLMFNGTCGLHPVNWLSYVRQDEPIIINGKMWKNPVKCKRLK
jgi:hypothetical protein